MKKNKLTKAMMPLLLGATAVAGAQMATEAGVGGQAPNSTNGALTVLWDQLSETPRGNGLPDQNFEAAYDIYDTTGADDFVVSGYGSSIQQIATVGTQGTGPAASVNVSFRADNAGSPAATALTGCDYAAIPVTDTAGSLSITLPTACNIIGAGTYWVTIQVNQDFATAGQHFWSNTDTVAGNEAHWSNPLDGFGNGCTTFQPAGTVCGVGGGAPAYDLLYSLSGTQLSAPVAALPVPSLNWLGMGLLILTMGVFGRRFVKKAKH